MKKEEIAACAGDASQSPFACRSACAKPIFDCAVRRGTTREETAALAGPRDNSDNSLALTKFYAAGSRLLPLDSRLNEMLQ